MNKQQILSIFKYVGKPYKDVSEEIEALLKKSKMSVLVMQERDVVIDKDLNRMLVWINSKTGIIEDFTVE